MRRVGSVAKALRDSFSPVAMALYEHMFARVNRGKRERQPLDFFSPLRVWWNGRHACFRSTCPYGRGGSTPLTRILAIDA